MTITSDELAWMFHDPEWKNKFLVGSLLAFAGSAVPLIGLVGLVMVYGYALILMRTAMHDEPRTLPKWDNFGKLFGDGLKAILSALGYFAPALLLFAGGFIIFFVGIFGSVFGAASARGSNAPSPLFPLSFIIGEFGFFACIGIAILVSYVGYAFVPVAIGQYLRTGNISSGYRWSEVWRILRANLSGFVLAWATYLGIGIVTGVVALFAYFTVVLCFLLPLLLAPITFYLTLIFARFFGMAYREGASKAGLLASQPSAANPPVSAI